MPTDSPEMKTKASELSESPKFLGVTEFEQIAWNVIDEDRDQHGSTPEIDIVDPLCMTPWDAHHQERRHPYPAFGSRGPDGFRSASLTREAWKSSFPAHPPASAAARQAYGFAAASCKSRSAERRSAGLDQLHRLVSLEQIKEKSQALRPLAR